MRKTIFVPKYDDEDSEKFSVDKIDQDELKIIGECGIRALFDINGFRLVDTVDGNDKWHHVIFDYCSGEGNEIVNMYELPMDEAYDLLALFCMATRDDQEKQMVANFLNNINSTFMRILHEDGDCEGISSHSEEPARVLRIIDGGKN